jgi:type I restriction enzyme S subunit
MIAIQQLITEHMDIWTGADTGKRSGRGRASGNAGSFYGVKKLRELILELAVRGKLLPQDANDEPASEILKRIQAQKTKSLAATAEVDKPFDLPIGWEWVSFGEIAQHNSGKTLDKGRNKGVLRDYITTSNLYWGVFELDSVKQMPIEESELERCTAQKGDLLICEGGEAGRAAVWNFDKEVCFQNHVHRARLYEGISPFYAYWYFEKLNASGEIEQYRKGVGISNMSGKALSSVVFSLPPLAEQHRIVTKVDELMALCDQLEAQHSNAAEAHEKLVSHLLGTLTQSQSADDFNANWQRIVAHFDTLFTTEVTIDALKQTLLQIAVMGKLVPQVHEWKVLKLSDLGFWAIGSGFPTSEQGNQDNDILFVKVSDMNLAGNEKFINFANNTITIETAKRIKINVHAAGTVIFPKIGGAIATNKRRILTRDTAIDNNCLGLTPKIGVSTEWLYLLLSSIDLSKYQAGTSVPALAQGVLQEIPVILPSENEQKNIVAKVDELMALCDQLKTRIQQASKHQQQLADVLVAQAMN